MTDKNERTDYLRRGGSLLLGAHADDVVIAIQKVKNFFPTPQTLVTVFSDSHHASLARRLRETTAIVREGEDRRYAAQEEMQYLGLGFEDNPESVTTNGSARSRLVTAVRERLFDVVEECAPQFVLAPLAIRRGPRQHVHHQVVFDAAADALNRHGSVILALYDDLVYTRLPISDTPRVNGASYVAYVVPLCDEELQIKLERMRIYRSQATDRFHRFVSCSAPEDDRNQTSEVVRLPTHVQIAALEEFVWRRASRAGREPAIPRLLRLQRIVEQTCMQMPAPTIGGDGS